MTAPIRLAGVDGGLINVENGDINFFVNLEDGGKLAFVASPAVAGQAASTLGALFLQSLQMRAQSGSDKKNGSNG